jgi:ATP:ADP antiporter, AAA family
MNILKKMYGNFQSKDEVLKFVMLGIAFFLIIGTYWTLRPLKDGLFASIVGATWQPYAKVLSMLAVFPIVMFYSKLVDWFRRDQVFYILSVFYAITAFIFALCFLNSNIGLANTIESPDRILGWAWYIWVESFGSLIVALFWAYTADITDPQSAKRGYPLIVMLGQLGNIVGPLILTNLGKTAFHGHNGPVVAITGVLILAVGFMIWLFAKVVPASQRQTYKTKDSAVVDHDKAGFFEGLKLLVKTPYLLSIFFIITIYEIIVTVFDFLFKIEVATQFTSSADRVEMLGQYAWLTGLVAFLCVLLGINNIQRKLGMTISLLMLPLLVAFALVSTKFFGGLYLFLAIMVFAKAVNYALNQPTLKQLYIPTSEDAKYKSQAWIEMFGSRASKGGGSGFNMLRDVFIKKTGLVAGVAAFMNIFFFGGLSLIILWVPIAMYAAKKYNYAVDNDKQVC